MALFCLAIRRDSVSLLRFPFPIQVHVYLAQFFQFVARNIRIVVFLLISLFKFVLSFLSVLMLSVMLLAAVVICFFFLFNGILTFVGYLMPKLF